MPTGTFITELLGDDNKIEIPAEVVQRLKLEEGDKIEVLVKKIRSHRLDIRISKNPLYKLLTLVKTGNSK